jgi:hypothetical protein
MNKSTTIHYNHKDVLYVKRGRRYHPINDPYAFDGLGEGHWAVHVQPSCSSIRRNIEPDYESVCAVLKEYQDEIVKHLLVAMEMRPQRTPISDKEKFAWDQFKSTMGEDMPKLFEYASVQECAEKASEFILNKIKNENADQNTD